MRSRITSLVGEKLEGGNHKWGGTLAAPNGSLYGIPNSARRVLKFNSIDKSVSEIGPDFGDGGWKWSRGAITESGIIYCVPLQIDRGILKIDTNTDTVIELDFNLLPEQGDYRWRSCALALDGCIYCMPYNGCRIMKLDPNNNDAMSSVGDAFEAGLVGTVVGVDGCVYGIPYDSNRIIKYNPVNDTTSSFATSCFEEETDEDWGFEYTSCFGEETDEDWGFQCNGNGALGRDGCIYAFTYGDRILIIDTANNTHWFVRSSIHFDLEERCRKGWCDAILGIDGCIYWPPFHDRYTLKYDPHTNKTSLVGCDFGSEEWKWSTGALAPDGVIYCIPDRSNQVLAIDPWGEFLEGTKADMKAHPERFGYLFYESFHAIEVNDDSDDDSVQTHFDHAVLKFGQKKVFEVLDQAMKPVNVYCQETNLFPFMIVAYYGSTLSAINHFLCRDLSWVDNCTSSLKGKGKTLANKKVQHKKRKHSSLV